MQWLNANHQLSPVTRHALFVLESIDAIDMAFDTFACAMLEGETDTSGYPEYNAIIGGVASHWDEATGDMIVRGVVGWGGRGVRGDTDRIASRILGGLLTNILANQHAMGLTAVERPVPAAGRGGLVCAHCGFASARAGPFMPPAGWGCSAAESSGRRHAGASHRTTEDLDDTTNTPAAPAHRTDLLHGFNDEGSALCPSCGGGTMRKLFAPPRSLQAPDGRRRTRWSVAAAYLGLRSPAKGARTRGREATGAARRLVNSARVSASSAKAQSTRRWN